MSVKTLMIAGAVLAASAALPAAAAPAQPSPPREPIGAAVMFNLLDRNGDGVIDKSEADAVAGAIFAAIDTNGDGSVSQQELEAALSRLHHGRGPQFGMGGPEFDRGQRDGWQRDGWRRDGWRHYGWQRGRGMYDMRGMADRPPMTPGQASNDDGAGAPTDQMAANQQPGGQAAPDSFRLRIFERLDANGDGVISRDEFAAAGRMFPGMGPGPAPEAPPAQ